MSAGDHIIYLLEVQNARTGEQIADVKPMVHIRKNGFGY
jgi:flavin reductase (DIM6/NTAB) family NADH-FMN oxidoreductase RutF